MYITDLSFSVVYILDCAGTRRDFALTHYDPVIQGCAPIKIEGSPVLWASEIQGAQLMIKIF